MGTDGQTARPDLSSLQQEVLLCGFRMVLFYLVVPIWMHFLCFPGVLECSLATQAAGSRVSALPSLANLPSLVLWTGFYWAFKIYVHLYEHHQQITETCKQNLPLPFLEPKAGREKLSGPRLSVGHRSLAWQQLRCSLTPDNSVPALLPYQAIQTHLALREIRE